MSGPQQPSVEDGRIRRLPDPLISKIAAGEVVERPASIVKELLENSLDAGASRIEIEVEEGGRRKIVVRDDGVGMAEEDARLAFERHATSKIDDFEDLERIASYGFRGEALSSVAAVARTELTTAPEPGNGLRILVRGGEVERVEPSGSPRGTRIEVRDLFAELPARRRFLKTASAEMRRCLEVVQGYALALPEVAFSFRSDGRELLSSSRCEDDEEGRLERVAQVFGVELASQLVALPHRPGVSGFVGRPSTTRGRRIFVFVNRRLVRDRGVLAAFYRTVRDEWKSERFPALFLFIDLPPEEVDVNVHPQKAEVRFRDQRIVGRVVNSLRSALAEGRTEEEAPVRAVDSIPATGVAWEGRGSADDGPTEVGEPPGPYAGAGSTGGSLLEDAGRRIRPFVPGRTVSSSPLSRGSHGRPLRLLGQYKGSLLLLEGEDGLYLVDQHAAHERILYERFRAESMAGPVASQRLLSPRWLEVSASEASALDEVSKGLQALGFELSVLSGDSVGLTSVPAFFGVEEAERAVLDLAARVDASEVAEEETEFLRKEVLEALAASSACRSAVKIHHRLSDDQMERLVSDLFAAEQPYTCPHGRPTLLKMGDDELERRFGRR